MKERRQHPRKKVQVLVLEADRQDPRLGYAKDVSRGGLFVGNSRVAEERDTAELALYKDTELHRCRARVVHRSEDGVGLEFIDPSAEFLEAIKAILDRGEDE